MWFYPKTRNPYCCFKIVNFKFWLVTPWPQRGKLDYHGTPAPPSLQPPDPAAQSVSTCLPACFDPSAVHHDKLFQVSQTAAHGIGCILWRTWPWCHSGSSLLLLGCMASMQQPGSGLVCRAAPVTFTPPHHSGLFRPSLQGEVLRRAAPSGGPFVCRFDYERTISSSRGAVGKQHQSAAGVCARGHVCEIECVSKCVWETGNATYAHRISGFVE